MEDLIQVGLQLHFHHLVFRLRLTQLFLLIRQWANVSVSFPDNVELGIHPVNPF